MKPLDGHEPDSELTERRAQLNMSLRRSPHHRQACVQQCGQFAPLHIHRIHRLRAIRVRGIAVLVLGVITCLGLSACVGSFRDRLVYDQQGMRVGIERDPTTDPSQPTGMNSHPAHWTAEEVRKLLGSLRVSGWSGTITGLFATPQSIPVFTEEQLQLAAQPIAAAFGQAGPQQRVFFTIPDLQKPYRRDRTAGAMFARGPLFYLTLSDHMAFIRTDTSGGDDLTDPRDTKGMKLSVARPAQLATPPPNLEPHWGPFEKVHVALAINESLAAGLPSTPLNRISAQPSPSSPVAPPRAAQTASDPSTAASDSSQELRLQIRELTSSNLELRGRLEEQTQQMEKLKEELARIQRELDRTMSKPQPRRKTPSVSPP